ncbi:MAG: hypothetical protein ACJAUC_000484 [Planctomycetota bacterium]
MADAAAAAGVCLLWFVTPRATKLVLRHKDLLVPCGCYLLADQALTLLPLQYASTFYLQPTWNPTIIIPALSWLAATLLVITTFAVWQALVIVQAVTSDGFHLLGELRHTRQLLPRGLGILAVAYIAVHGPLIIGIWLGVMSVPGLLWFFMIGWAIYSVAVGIMTCLWLPLAVLFACASIAVKITLIQRIDDHHPDARDEHAAHDYTPYEEGSTPDSRYPS